MHPVFLEVITIQGQGTVLNRVNRIVILSKKEFCET